jgi:two-component system phosphate regulon sensor histidine kinase PhoR
MSLSRIEADRYSLPQDVVELAGVLHDVRDTILTAHDLAPDRIVVTVETASSGVLGDRAQLSQLAHNLIGNAIKYGRADSPVAVAITAADPGSIRLSVIDQGEGIAAEHLPRLTERFYRVDPGRSRSLGGTGLGLAICKHIVERHRGQLRIDSVVGRGTTVTVLFPLVESAAAPADERVAAQSA